MNRSLSKHGFTLVEMLVAITIALIMIILVGRLFLESSEAVQRGVALSDTITSSRGANTQFQNDIEEMLGPHEGNAGDAGGGFIVIAQHMYYPDDPLGIGVDGVEVAKPSGPDDITEFRPAGGVGSGVGRGRSVFRAVRSDQLVFITNRGDQFPIAPAATSAFTPGADNGLAQYVKVWYGHGNRTNPNGSDYDVAGANDDATREGALGNSGYESVASDWFLCRQALFLGESLASNPSGSLPSYHANGASVDAPVVGSGAPVTLQLYMGLTDYAYASLDDPSHTHGCIVTNNDNTGANATRRLYADTGLQSFSAYRILATRQFAYTRKRLRGNPSPDVATANFEPWQIGQMHPFFIEHVSDFIVEFAGDYHDNSVADNTPPPFAPDGLVDTDDDGNIKWYSHWYNNPIDGRRNPSDGNPPVIAQWSNYLPSESRTYPFPGGVPVAVPSPLETFTTAKPPFADASFVWRHDDEADKYLPDATYPDNHSLWPYLIRVRYRIHDKKGKLGSVGQHGVWFEQVFKVNRPPAP